MATQRKDDHLDRRIPESQEEGAFDRDLHRTLDLTIRQINDLEEKIEFSEETEEKQDLSFDRIEDLENRLDQFESSFDSRLGDLRDRVDQIESESRDEVFTEPVELRARKTEVFGSDSSGAHTVEFGPDEVAFKSKPGGKIPFAVRPQSAVFRDKARFDGAGQSRYTDIWAEEDGNLQIAPKRPDESVVGLAPADIEIEADEFLPKEPYETSIGSEQKKFLSMHVAELWVESLVAQKKIATIGGNIFVGPTTELTQPVSGDSDDAASHAAADYYNYVRVKHNQMAPGDVVMMKTFTRVEFMRVEEGPVEIEAENKEEGGDDNPFDFVRDHNYRYRVERDLDGSGANTWDKGAAVANTGRKRSGFIDLYAERSRRSENESGPSMAISVRDEDKSSYGEGEWAAGVDYKTGDIVYWDADDWTVGTDYQAGDIVFYSPRDQHYVAQVAHTSSESDEPLESSPKWSAQDATSDGNYAAQTDHTSSENDLPLSGNTKWSEVEVTDYFNKWSERSAIGNLDGLYDYNSEVYGVAGGKYESSWFAVDEEQGFRLMNQDTMVGNWGTGGFVRVGPSIGGSSSPENWAGVWQAGIEYEVGDTVQSPSDGLFYIASTDHTSSSSDSPISGSGKWSKQEYPVEIAPSGETVFRGTIRIPDGDGGYRPPGVNWRGTWQTGVDYKEQDGVYYAGDGNSYICEIAHTSSSSDEPIDQATDGNGNDLWSLFAETVDPDVQDIFYLDTDGPRRIKNSKGTVKAVIRKIEGDGTVSLYTGSDYQITNVDQSVSYGTSQRFGPDDIDGQKTLVLEKKSSNKAVDTMDVLDVTDGLGGGYVEAPDQQLVRQLQSGGFIPTESPLTGVFFRVGETSTPEEYKVTVHPFYTDVGNGSPELAATYTTTPNADGQTYPEWTAGNSYNQGDTVSHDVSGDGNADTHFVATEDNSTTTEPQNSPFWAEYDDQTAFSITVENSQGVSLNESTIESDAVAAQSVFVKFEFTDPVTGDRSTTSEEIYIDEEETPGRFTSYVFTRNATKPATPENDTGGTFESPTPPSDPNGNVTWQDGPPTSNPETPLWMSKAVYEYTADGPIDTNGDGDQWTEPTRVDADDAGLFTVWAPRAADGTAPPLPSNLPSGEPENATWSPGSSSLWFDDAEPDPANYPAWDSSTDYGKGDRVSYNGEVYVAVEDPTGSEAPDVNASWRFQMYYMAQSQYDSDGQWGSWERMRVRGETAKAVQITSEDGIVFRKNQDGSHTPSSIQLTATPRNIGSPSYSWSSPDISLSSSGSSVSVDASSLPSGGKIQIQLDVTDGVTGEVLEDKIVLHEVVEGSGGIQIIPSDPSHIFPTPADGVVTNFAGSNCKFRVYEGADQRKIQSASVVNVIPTGAMTPGAGQSLPLSDESGDGNNDVATYDPTSIGDDVNTATVSVEVTAELKDGSTKTLTSNVSYAKNGIDAAGTRIVSPTQVVAKKDGSFVPSSITLEAVNQNVQSPSYSWSTPNGDFSGITTTNQTLTVDETNFASDDTLEVNLGVTDTALDTSPTYNDTETLHLVREGSDGLTLDLSNNNHTFDARSDGTVVSPENGSCTFTLFQGADQIDIESPNEGNAPDTKVIEQPSSGFSYNLTQVSDTDGNKVKLEPTAVPDTSFFLVTVQVAAQITNSANPNGKWVTREGTITYTRKVDGINARIGVDDSVVEKDAQGNYKNTPIVLSAVTRNLPSGLSYEWDAKSASDTDYSTTADHKYFAATSDPVTGSSASLDPNTTSLVDESVTVRLTVDAGGDTFTDEETFPVVEEGAEGVTIVTSNDTHDFPTNEDGDIVPALSTGSFNAWLYEGGTKMTLTSKSVADNGPFSGFSVGGTSEKATFEPTGYGSPFSGGTVTIDLTGERANGETVSQQAEIQYNAIDQITITGNTERGQDAKELGATYRGAALGENALGFIRRFYKDVNDKQALGGKSPAGQGDLATISGNSALGYRLDKNATTGYVQSITGGYWVEMTGLSDELDHKDRWQSWISDTGDLYLNDASDDNALEYKADFNGTTKGLFALGEINQAKKHFDPNKTASSDPRFFGWHDGELALNGKSILERSLTGREIEADSVTVEELTISDALQVKPGGSFILGSGEERFAFGDFDLNRTQKSNDSPSIGVSKSFTSPGEEYSDFATDTRSDISVQAGEFWAAEAYNVDYYISKNEQGDYAKAVVTVIALDGNSNSISSSSSSEVLPRYEEGQAKSGFLSVTHVLPEGTEAVQLELSVFVETGVDSNAGATAEIGADAGTDPTYTIYSSTDFLGNKGAIWRDTTGSPKIILNAADTSSAPKSTSPGDIWIDGTINAGNVNDRSSDRRLKENVESIDRPLEIIRQMEGKTFDYRGKRSGGLIAQDAVGVYDAAVGRYDMDGTEYFSLDEKAFMGPVVEGMKVIDERVTSNRSRIEKLEEENRRLRKKIVDLKDS